MKEEGKEEGAVSLEEAEAEVARALQSHPAINKYEQFQNVLDSDEFKSKQANRSSAVRAGEGSSSPAIAATSAIPPLKKLQPLQPTERPTSSFGSFYSDADADSEDENKLEAASRSLEEEVPEEESEEEGNDDRDESERKAKTLSPNSMHVLLHIFFYHVLCIFAYGQIGKWWSMSFV